MELRKYGSVCHILCGSPGYPMKYYAKFLPPPKKKKHFKGYFSSISFDEHLKFVFAYPF